MYSRSFSSRLNRVAGKWSNSVSQQARVGQQLRDLQQFLFNESSNRSATTLQFELHQCQRGRGPQSCVGMTKTFSLRVAVIAGMVCLNLAIAAPIGAQSQSISPSFQSPPRVANTPELDSLALFGVGAAGMAGYVMMRLRARRRQDKDTD